MGLKMRQAQIKRKTKETQIVARLNLDGSGKIKVNTGVGLLDHMLELFAFWGKFDLSLQTHFGDFKVDIHHTNEDLGIVLGQAFKLALKDKSRINRNGFASFPMEDTTADVTVDISGRGSFCLDMLGKKATLKTQEGYDIASFSHFLDSLAKNMGLNLNVRVYNPSPDLHATLEPIFKALGKALAEAVAVDPRRKGIPSTKGVID